MPRYDDLTSFPALRMDLSLALDEDVRGRARAGIVRQAAGELLADVRVFDVYRGEQVGEGRSRWRCALDFRAADRTLTDEDVAPVRERIVAALGEQLGGELRG